MRFQSFAVVGLLSGSALAVPRVSKRSDPANSGQPINNENGRGAPLLGKMRRLFHKFFLILIDLLATGGTNKAVDLQNPDQLRTPTTDNGFVPNVKWSFSQSQTRLFPGGWSREQVIQDLPQSHDIAGAQQHLKKGATRELHWHRVVWGFHPM